MLNTFSPVYQLLMSENTSPTPAVRYPSPPPALRWLRWQLRVLQAVAPALAFRLAWRVFCTPQRLPAKAWEANVLDGARHRMLPTPAGPVAVYEWGAATAPAVVLVHGWEHRASFWHAWLAPLQTAGYRVVALDAPAHGASPGRQLNLKQYGAAIQAVVDAAAATGPVQALVAHSFGGAAVAGVPVRLPGGAPLPRLLLLSVPVHLRAVAQRFTDLLRLPASQISRMESYIERLTGRPWHSFAPAVAGPGIGAEKVLLLHDEADAIVPFTEGQQIAAAWPGATLHATRSLGHNRILRDAGVVARAVGFLA